MISILPESQAGKDGVSTVYQTVTIPTSRQFVILRQSTKAIGCPPSRLRRVVAKQFCAVIYRTVAVSIQRKPRIV